LRQRIEFTLLGLFFCAAALPAQQREVQRYGIDSPEGRLMGFYSSALGTTPLGAPLRGVHAVWSAELALEVGYIPWLTRAQRSAGFDKPEASNLSPVLPRPHLALLLPAELLVDVSWVPPVGVLDATANLFGLSVRRTFEAGAFTLSPRMGLMIGRVEGAITCSEDLGSGAPEEQIYYANVCHANESNDYFDPAHLSVDVTLAKSSPARRTPWITAGLRREDVTFDIGVMQASGERDPDHPVLEMEATRFFAATGLQWEARRTRYGMELFYSPGSLLTARFFGALRIR
jgi:hypothetical protein